MEILKLSPKPLKILIYKTIFYLYKILRPKGFLFKNQIIHYENSFYNTSFFNERYVEIPLIKELLKNYNNTDFLEVGNVLMHYEYTSPRDIVDKYEISEGVLNIDIKDYENKNYSLILSISTLEHVGLDEGEKIIDERKLERCIANIVDYLLIDKGVFIITLPVNYNHNVDKFIFDNKLFQEKFFMVKDNLLLNTWKKIDFDQILVKYRKKPLLIEEVFIGIYTKN